jgi:hypothetical protein
MSGRSIASQRPWQIVHSGRERRGGERARRLTRKTRALAAVTLLAETRTVAYAASRGCTSRLIWSAEARVATSRS